MDTGSAIKGKNRFDFAVLDKKFAYALGQQYYDVYLVKMGNGKITEPIITKPAQKKFNKQKTGNIDLFTQLVYNNKQI